MSTKKYYFKFYIYGSNRFDVLQAIIRFDLRPFRFCVPWKVETTQKYSFQIGNEYF